MAISLSAVNAIIQPAHVQYLSLLAKFSRYAAARGCRRCDDVDRVIAETFLRRLRASSGTVTRAESALGHVRCGISGKWRSSGSRESRAPKMPTREN